jgi:hypothetical protein
MEMLLLLEGSVREYRIIQHPCINTFHYNKNIKKMGVKHLVLGSKFSIALCCRIDIVISIYPNLCSTFLVRYLGIRDY